MITPAEALAAITDEAFKEGQNAAEVFWRYTPAPLDPEWVERAQDNVVDVVVYPFTRNPHFAQLPDFLNAVRISAWDGFERRWRELKNEGPRPLDHAGHPDEQK